MWARHRALHLHLWEGLREMGLEPFVEKEQYRLISVNTIKVRLAHAKPSKAASIMERPAVCMSMTRNSSPFQRGSQSAWSPSTPPRFNAAWPCHCSHGQLQSLNMLSDSLALYRLHDLRS